MAKAATKAARKPAKKSAKPAKAAKTKKTARTSASKLDLEAFRLRRFVDRLIDMGEVEIKNKPVALADISNNIESTRKAVLFKKAGPQKSELIANVSGSRRRIAAAFDTTEENVVAEYQRRADTPQPVVRVPEGDAPVQQVVLEGDDADLTKLPFHIQHELDGSVYISSGIDFTIDPETGITNVGCRRLSLRGPRSCGTNVTAPSDLKRIYQGCVARGENLPISFAVGTHPLDLLASGMRIPTDEVTLVGTMRGAPVPLVKSITNDIPVPADAEMIIEGYFGSEGYIEPEGPYGEYVGYYGPMHLDPIFHVTAITTRKDVLHQTVLHGSGRVIGQMESSNLGAIRLEAQIARVLKSMQIDVVAVHVPPSSAEGQHVRVSIRQSRPGQSRNAINAVFASILSAKHVFVVDEDIDVFDEEAMEWAFVSRFQADRDMVVQSGLMGMPLDPSRIGPPPGTKAGFDLTLPFGRRNELVRIVASAPTLSGPARFQTVRQALEAGPIYFSHLMEAVGSQDGREIAVELDQLRIDGELERLADGRYQIGVSEKGRTGLPEGSGDDPNAGLSYTRR